MILAWPADQYRWQETELETMTAAEERPVILAARAVRAMTGVLVSTLLDWTATRETASPPPAIIQGSAIRGRRAARRFQAQQDIPRPGVP